MRIPGESVEDDNRWMHNSTNLSYISKKDNTTKNDKNYIESLQVFKERALHK
jgi:hypothetical protein